MATQQQQSPSDSMVIEDGDAIAAAVQLYIDGVAHGDSEASGGVLLSAPLALSGARPRACERLCEARIGRSDGLRRARSGAPERRGGDLSGDGSPIATDNENAAACLDEPLAQQTRDHAVRPQAKRGRSADSAASLECVLSAGNRACHREGRPPSGGRRSPAAPCRSDRSPDRAATPMNADPSAQGAGLRSSRLKLVD
jgi:hypothetical protein